MSKWVGGVVRGTKVTPAGNFETDIAPGIWRGSDAAYLVSQQQWPGTAPRDPYFPYNSLLLSGNSADRGQNSLFVDSSSNYYPVTRYGNANQGTPSPYGNNWSNYFDGAGDYLTIADNAAFGYGTGDFTIEFWYYPTGTADQTIFSNLSSASSTNPHLYYSAGTIRYYTVSADRITSSAITLYQWYHIALCRSSGSTRLFVNGTQAGSTYTDGNNYGASAPLGIATYWSGGSPVTTNTFAGSMSNVRIVKGTALYTSAFTPPTQPLTAISGTSLLTCQANRFIDASTNNFAITRTGDVRVRPGPFAAGASFLADIRYRQNDIPNRSNYFDGNGDYLGWSGYTAMAFGSSAFTIEAWVYLNAMPTADDWPTTWSSHMVIATVGSPNTGDGTGFLIGSNRLALQINDTAYWSTSHGMTSGQWYHLAVTRSSNTLYFFVNGVAKGTAAYSGSAGTGTGTYVGCETGQGAWLNGYISNLRCINGTALYTSGFTPPSTALTAVTGTSLLTCQSPAFNDNSTNKFSVVAYGDTKVIGFSPFNTVGYNSVYFDGSGDYLSVPASASWIFSGDYTLEAWVFPTAENSDMHIAGTGGGGSNDQFGITSGIGTGRVYWAYGAIGNNYLTTTATIPAFKWSHIAVTRSGSTLRAFVNGVQVYSGAMTTSIGQNATNYIGRRGDGYNSFTGYISNLRLVNGTAAYTAAFTPPTTPLTAITNTSLLTCQNNTLKDNSTNAFTVTGFGDAKVQTFNLFDNSVAITDTGSLYFDGSGDYLALPTQAGQIGTGDFTLECWYRSNTSTASTHCPIIANYENNSNGSWALKASSSNDQCVQFAYYNNGWFDLTTTKNITADMAWHHVAVTRQGTTLRLYVDGALINSWTVSATLGGNGYTVQLGRIANDNAFMNGYMSDARLVTGTALYTGSTYTVPTAPLTSIVGTKFLVNGLNAGIADLTRNNAMETVGDTKISTAVKKYGTGSIQMDGNGDWLIMPGSEAFHFGSSNFTIEGWFYFTSATTNSIQTLFTNYYTWGASGQGTIFWGKHNNNSGYLTAWFANYSTGGPLLAESSYPSSNTWVHYALVRNGNTFTIYRDGSATASATWSGAATSTNPPAIHIGTNGDGGQYPFPGYIDDFRITRGIARYTSNFTPPTQSLPSR